MSSAHLVGLLLLAGTLPLAAQQPATAPAAPAGTALPAPSTPLVADPKVRIGTLSNGLRYYIRQNAKPEKRAELRLVVNAGSVLEKENQLGYAHFIEHMAFNGTTRFAKNQLVSYLQSIGVQFGADLNAYTGFDETVYILPVPTDTAAIVTRAFDILEDWAHGQTFDSTEVVSERGVVLEEWRGRKGAGDRMLRRILPVVLKDSRYATRLPIGTERSIGVATPSVLRSFYDSWYRPDLMAVVAVGDFSPDSIESQIRSHFAGLTAKPNPEPRPIVQVPGNRAPLVVIASDKEATNTTVQVSFKAAPERTLTVGDYRRRLIENLYSSMLNARLAEIVQRPDAPFLGAIASKQQFFVRSVSGFTLGAAVKDGGVERGLDALLTETRRVDQYGFLPAELDRAKLNLLRAYDGAYTERAKTNSGAYAQDYVINYLVGDVVPGIEAEYQLARQMIPAIGLAEVNTSASKWITDENRVVVVSAPQKADVVLPGEQQLLAVFDRAAKAPLTAYVETVSGDALLAKAPAPGKVTAERVLPGTDVIEWTLSNGARVLLKPTDFKADEVLFSAYANGGTSLASNQEFMSATLSTQLAALGGVGSLNRLDLTKKLSGKSVRVLPTMSETTQGLAGGGSPKDLETLLQLAYLQFTAPRLDTLAYQTFRNQIGPFLQNRSSDPNSVFGDTVAVTLSQHDFRSRPITTATVNEVNLDRAFAFYRDRFADASNFTFVFVGTFEPAAVKPLVERYLASLPSTGRKESFKNVTNGPPKGVVDVTVRKGSENKASSLLVFTGVTKYTPESRLAIRALTDYLQIKLIETLREQLGGTYSPGVGSRIGRTPREEYAVQVQFSSSPENVAKLTPAVFALIDTLQRNGPSAADVEKVRAQMVRQRETEVKQNSYWLSNIIARVQANEDIAGLGTDYDRMIRALSPATIQDAAKRFLDVRNYARFVLLPESQPPTP